MILRRIGPILNTAVYLQSRAARKSLSIIQLDASGFDMH